MIRHLFLVMLAFNISDASLNKHPAADFKAETRSKLPGWYHAILADQKSL